MIAHKKMSGTLRAFLLACGVCLISSALFAGVSYRLLGPILKVTASAGSAGDGIVFVWDEADRGDDVANWAHSAVVTESVPTGGSTYRLDLASLGVTEGMACGLVATRTYQCLDRLGTFNGAYVDTGVKDTDCYGVAFGFYATTKTTDWGYFIGTYESNGFTIGNNSSNFASWNWAYRTGKGSPRPTVKTDSVNEVSFHDAEFWLNGTQKASSLGDGSVGLSGSTMYVGRAVFDSRIQYGWWTHVELVGADGKNLIEYVPTQQSDGTVGFYDRVSGSFVKPTSGTFTAGSLTGTTISQAFPHIPFTAANCEPITVSVAGARLTADVPASFAGEQLLLVWDDEDKGDQPENWAQSAIIAPILPAGGGTVTADLRALGVRNGQAVRVVARHVFDLLDQVKVSSGSYVDTGVKDSECTRAAFGFYAEQSDYSNTEWGVFIGTHETQGTTDIGGFLISLENGNPEKWFWKAFGYRASGERPTVSKTAINEAVFAQSAVVVNGDTKKSALPNGVLGTTGANIYLGKASIDYRHQAGWWSHLELAGADGMNMVEYVPVRRLGDGKVGFYDRVGDRFVKPSGTDEIVAGTVTNAAVSIVHVSVSVVARIEDPLTLAIEGSTLTVNVPAGHAQERLTLAWGEQSVVMQEVLPAEGGAYVADLSALGIGVDDVCTVTAEQNVQLLDQLQMTDRTTYVDTGIPDSRCYGVALGFRGTGITEGFAPFIGTYEANNDVNYPGFTVGADNENMGGWYWAYQGIKYYPRPKVKTDEINEAQIGNGVFRLNGDVVNSALPSGPVGRTNRMMHLGCWEPRNRFFFGWWSYARFTDAGGNAILDYIPAKRVADDAVGFLDRATGAFVTSTGGGTFTAGSVTNTAYAFPCASRTFTVGGLVVTARWTGTGSGLMDPASWSCRNALGETVEGIPTAETAVVIPDGVVFSAPAGSPFLCKTLELPSVLTADADLASVTFDRILAKDIDLAGHALTLTLVADSEQQMAVSDSVGGGVLTFVVPKNCVAENKTVVLTGGLKLAKVGEGVFVAAKKNQSYTGGTEVLAGTFMCGGKGSEGVYGAADGTLTVGPGAAFDCGGYNGHAAAKLVLAGGEVVNSKSASSSNDGWFADVTLTADSFARADKGLAFRAASGGSATLEMNGHKLTIDVDPDYTFGLYDLTVTGGGTIYGRSGGFIQLVRVTAETTTLETGVHSLDVASPTTFLNYIARYSGNWDKSPNAPIRVLGRFTPVGASWHSVEFQDGAVLDLSQRSGVWSATCKMSHYAGPSSISFADGATVRIDVGERQPALGDQLVSWPTKPVGAKDATFAWDLDLPLHAKSKGLFVQERPGIVILVK